LAGAWALFWACGGSAGPSGDISMTTPFVDTAQLHVSLLKNGSQICPEPYFTPEAQAAVLALIHETTPSWMCY